MSQDLHHLAAAYALDALEPGERERFEAHLDECPDCAADVREFHDTAHELAEAVGEAPPERLRSRILDQVAVTRQESRSSASTTIGPARRAFPALVAAVLVFVALGMGVVARNAIVDRNRAEDLLTVLAALDAQVAPLEGSATPATLRVVWSPSLEASVVLGTDLPRPDSDQVYELWVLSAEGPRSAGVFRPADDGRIEQRLGLPAVPEGGWGVTIEPAGGSPQPTGDILFVG
jgi:anti-sigma-K factor RskA